MAMVTIAGQEVDADDPCALYAALYQAKLKMLDGTLAEEVEIRSAITNRRVRYSAASMKALDAELRHLQQQCQAKTSGRPARFAIQAGFRRY
ncbi:hypothetical protein [Jiella marina]|uniref:hypothetical protein n=1 Tax=Jiella sp. LLJ827 TaxID=2917712 RepID=UPI00210193E9|nr:hypothetical protein [Jiella sp. LLJ827]MCQ0986410.1 hypothetical protein [Jiella sp. LLJ827]